MQDRDSTSERPDGIEVISENAWREFKEKHTHPIDVHAIEYAERWAHFMELKMREGYYIEEVAEAAGYEAGLGYIKPRVYPVVVRILTTFWKYGEHLRRWHNIHHQSGNEGERANSEGRVLPVERFNVRAQE